MDMCFETERPMDIVGDLQPCAPLDVRDRDSLGRMHERDLMSPRVVALSSQPFRDSEIIRGRPGVAHVMRDPLQSCGSSCESLQCSPSPLFSMVGQDCLQSASSQPPSLEVVGATSGVTIGNPMVRNVQAGVLNSASSSECRAAMMARGRNTSNSSEVAQPLRTSRLGHRDL